MKTLLALIFLLVGFASPALADADPTPLDPAAAVPYRTTEHFRFYGDEEVYPILNRLAEDAEDRFMRMCRPIAACDRIVKPIDIWVAEDAEHFAAGFPEPNPMSEWAAGVTFLAQQRVILRAHGSAMLTLSETFDHELAHVLAHTYTQGDGTSVPRWFHEGLAIWQAGEGVLQRLETALKAASSGRLLTYEELATRYPNQGGQVEIAYAQSALFVKRMVMEKGPLAVIEILQDTGRGIDFATAFEARLGTTARELFARLDEDLEKTSSPFLFLHDGNFLWGLMTVLFVVVAWWRLKDRKRQMARLADTENLRIAAEDMALLAERTRASLPEDALAPASEYAVSPDIAELPPMRPIEFDEDGKPLLH